MHFDFTISLTTVITTVLAMIQGPIAVALWKVVRFMNVQKDFPPHRHINGHVLYPKDYAPEPEQTRGHAAGRI